MEYEICDEERLFDDSTNPSLERDARSRPARAWWLSPRAPNHGEQTAIAIPEEEHQLS